MLEHIRFEYIFWYNDDFENFVKLSCNLEKSTSRPGKLPSLMTLVVLLDSTPVSPKDDVVRNIRN